MTPFPALSRKCPKQTAEVEHFNGRPLAAQLERAGIAYRHAPELGGKPKKEREDVVKDDRHAPAPGRRIRQPEVGSKPTQKVVAAPCRALSEDVSRHMRAQPARDGMSKTRQSWMELATLELRGRRAASRAGAARGKNSLNLGGRESPRPLDLDRRRF